MIDETIILLTTLEDYSSYRLAGFIPGNLIQNTDIEMMFHRPLREIFSRVIAYDLTGRLLKIGLSGINREILELVKQERPRYVFWVSTMYEVLESTLDEIRKTGSTVVGWFGDDEYRFAFYSRWWIPHLDYCVTGDIEAVPKYKALGARVVHAFSCEGVPVEKDWSVDEDRYEVTFVGRRDKPQREYYVNEIRKRNIPVRLFGRGWDGGYVTADEMVEIFKTSKINLNFAATANRTAFKGRMVAICLAGGFMLTDYVPGLENYYDIGREIICFEDAPDMIDKIEYYLAHDEERRAVARAGWERSINEYTPFHMLSRVFESIHKDTDSGGEKPRPQQMKLPLSVRNSHSQYYFTWGRAFLEEGRESLWQDALKLSISSNPFNISAWYYRIVGSLPSFMRPLFFGLYRPFRALRKLITGILIWMIQLAAAVPYLKDLKKAVSRKLSYS